MPQLPPRFELLLVSFELPAFGKHYSTHCKVHGAVTMERMNSWMEKFGYGQWHPNRVESSIHLVRWLSSFKTAEDCPELQPMVAFATCKLDISLQPLRLA